MVKCLNTTRRSRKLRIVAADSRRIVHTKSNRTKAVLVTQPHQVRQFVRRNLRRQQHKVLARRLRLRCPDLLVTKLRTIPLVCSGVATLATNVVCSDHTTQQSVDLNYGSPAKAQIPRVNFTGKTTGPTKCRSVIEGDQRILADP